MEFWTCAEQGMKEVCLDLDNMQKYAIIFIVKKLQMRRRVSSGNRRIKKLFDDMTIEEKSWSIVSDGWCYV